MSEKKETSEPYGNVVVDSQLDQRLDKDEFRVCKRQESKSYWVKAEKENTHDNHRKEAVVTSIFGSSDEEDM